MTVLVAPDGGADVVRQFLSVYVTIVQSDYDPIQRWPFSLPITFTIMAADPRDNLRKVFTPNPIPENDAFLGRPKGARNAAFGIQVNQSINIFCMVSSREFKPFSQPFETHRFGYKMTVMVAPYGDADGIQHRQLC
ncbi:hypothetical protein OESDEN_13033 [Oesophagostomum dentatum]|uniref:TRAF1-6 MATH domain-containing protein n=1 Tax=Oesophagostomum dentatum TaxID=61180 RepID=A0A0B1SPG9_OESDE|nr:hypothetical protein OESDEN_13033 [Oesophagostomum dentatum]